MRKPVNCSNSHPFYIGLSQTLTTMLKRVTLAEKSAATMLLLSQLDAHNTAHPSQTNDPFLYPVAKTFGRVRSLKPHLKQGHTTQHSVAPTTETEHSSVFATKTSSPSSCVSCSAVPGTRFGPMTFIAKQNIAVGQVKV